LTLAAIGLAPTYGILLAVAILSGIFQAVANPSTNKLIAEHVPIGRRGIITGVKQSGVQFGTFVGGLTLPGLALAFDWRIAVAVFAGVALAAAGVAMGTLPPDIEMDEAETTAGDTGLPPLIARLAVYGFLLGAGGTAIFTYLPLYGQEGLGLSPQAAGAAAALVGLSGVIARIGWGRLAEVRLGAEAALRTMALGAVGAAALLWLAPELPFLIWPAAIVTGFTASAWNAVGMLAIIESVPSALAGRGSGIVLLGFLLGLGLGSPAMGWSVDALGSYRPGWAAIAVLFVGGWFTLRRR
jgi:predicted MFS family arabinose efflux permease